MYYHITLSAHSITQIPKQYKNKKEYLLDKTIHAKQGQFAKWSKHTQNKSYN